VDEDHGGWMVEHLWIYGRGKRHSYTTCDSDGNHEPCSSRDATSFCDEEHESWQQYNAWPAKHGRDLLSNFMMKYATVKKERWTFYLRNWIGAKPYGSAASNAAK